MLTLQHHVSIYVPGTVGNQSAVPAQYFQAELLARQLTNYFGGATAVKGTGYYRNSGDEHVREPVIIVTAYMTAEQWLEHSAKVWVAVRDIGSTMLQESVAVEVDGVLYLVTGEPNELSGQVLSGTNGPEQAEADRTLASASASAA